MSVLIWRESYLEKKNLKKSLQQLTSIFANYLKKKKKKNCHSFLWEVPEA